MATMNVSLPNELMSFVDHRVAAGGYQSTSEYVRELIRRDQDVQQMRALIVQGADSPAVGTLDKAYFDELRASLQARANGS